MNETGKAMIFDGPGKPLRPAEFVLPTLAKGEALVRVTCSTLCGSDVGTFFGRRTAPTPTILGHEIIGCVERLAEVDPPRDWHGEALAMGDRVTWTVAANCGVCFYCKNGLPQKCERLFKYGHERVSDDHPFSGGLAEYCHLAPGTAILKVADTLPDEIACPVNCATATVAAGFRVAGMPVDGGSVLVIGAGMLGLMATAMARSDGAREVIVCDVQEGRLEQARCFGATRVFRVGESPEVLEEMVAEASDGRGIDLAMDLTGVANAMELSLAHLRIGGACVWIGAVHPSRPIPLDAETLVRRMTKIVGVHNYAPEDLATALAFTETHAGAFPFSELVSRSFPLEQANEAFEAAQASGAYRVAVKP